MPKSSHPVTAPLTDADIAQLQTLLAELPAPLEPLDISALDGFLCGVLLQPLAVPAAQWLPFVADVEGRAPAPSEALAALHALAQRRHAELEHWIAARQWFDPWIADVGPQANPGDAVLPWTAGFALATEKFEALLALDDPALVEPLAVLFMHFDADDLEDADALLAVIETLEPPATLAEAAEDIVRSVLLLADVSRPRPPQGTAGKPRRAGQVTPRGRGSGPTSRRR